MIVVSIKPLFIVISTLSIFVLVAFIFPPYTPFSQVNSLPAKTNGYIRVDCYGGLNQMRRDLCDSVGIARLLNATLVLPKFEVAVYWNESSGFADVFDVDYIIQQMNGFIEVVKELPVEISSKEPFRVYCSKRQGQFDYVGSVLPSLLKHLQ